MDRWVLQSQTSNIIDHTKSEQHKSATKLFHMDKAKSRKEPVIAYSPIARSMLSMDPTTRERVRKKFDISLFRAKEHILFVKYPVIHELEEHHEVDLCSI